MPIPYPRPCSRCRKLQCDCPKVAARRYDERRGSSSERGYDGNWQRFRSWFIGRHVFCESDHGCRNLTREVHHVIKVNERPDLRLVESNCQALCGYHHRKLGGKGGRG